MIYPIFSITGWHVPRENAHQNPAKTFNFYSYELLQNSWPNEESSFLADEARPVILILQKIMDSRFLGTSIFCRRVFFLDKLLKKNKRYKMD